MHLPSHPSWRGALRCLGAALLLATGTPGWAQADPPARVAYISALAGAAEVSQADDPAHWAPATPNWPITTGTQLRLDPGARVELDGGWLALRLQGAADLSATALDDDTTQVALTAGSLSLRLHELDAGERVEIDTPQLALVARQPGEYRLDVDPGAGTTRVTVRTGAATLYGDAGQSMPLAGGSQVLVADRSLGLLADGPAPARDAFDQWVARRDAQQDGSVSARYLPRAMPGYQGLDAHGHWSQDATWGPVWYPSITAADWAPYRYGRWAWIEPWGWTWVDDAPWGFAPFHYGRWTQIGPRWAWVPGPVPRRPVYAPALVQFSAGGDGWSVSIGSSPLGAAWFPLAPGEAWRPHYHASPRYLGRINDWSRWRGPARRHGDDFFFQYRPGAVSIAPAGAFGRPRPDGPRPRYRDGHQLPAGWLQASRPAAPPARVRGPAAPDSARPHRPGWREQPAGMRPPASAPWSRAAAPGPWPHARSPQNPPLPQAAPVPGQARPGWRAPSEQRPLPERPRVDAPWHERRQWRPPPPGPAEAQRPAAPAPRPERPRPAFDAGAAGATRLPDWINRRRTESEAPPRAPHIQRAPERPRAAPPPAPWLGRDQAGRPEADRQALRGSARAHGTPAERRPEPRAGWQGRQHARAQRPEPRRERGEPSTRWRERMHQAP